MRTKLVLFAITLLMVLATPALAQGETPQCSGDQTPRVAVMSAFGAELDVLLSHTTVEQSCMLNGVEFTTGSLQGNDVILFLSGGSMVNAAMNTQLMIDHFAPTHIVFSGIAGGVDPDLNIGDVTVAEQWGQYQDTAFVRETSDGFAPPAWMGEPPFPNFGMSFPQMVHVRTDAHPEEEAKFWFSVDSEMFSVASQVADQVELAGCTADNVCLENVPRVVVGGNGVSGPTFVDNAAYREYVFQTFQARVLDMETAAAITVAYANDIPFIAFRSLSDLAGGGPGENEIGTFFQVAADNSAMVVEAFLATWSTHT